MNLTIENVLNACHGILNKGNKNDYINNISTDSRSYISDALFIPIIGEVYDGHNFLETAYENGYRSFIIDENHKFYKENINLIIVKDTTIALGDIAKYYRSLFNIPCVGITGSVGKTTTKDIIANVLSQKYITLKNEANLNNDIGVPKTIFNLTDKDQVAVIEMGMSSKGELDYLTRISKPNIAVISNIGMSHIEHFSDQNGIFEAKMEITNYFNKDNILIINGDDKFLKTLKTDNLKYKLLTYGFNVDNTIYCDNYRIEKDNIIFSCNYLGNHYTFTIPTIAKHNIYNAMSAILVGDLLGVSMDQIETGLSSFEITKGRLTVINKKNITIIDDTYNASLDSMKAALDVLKSYKGRRVAILGDILETGKYAETLHRQVGDNILNKADLLITVGKDSKYIAEEAIKCGYLEDNIIHFNSYEEVINNLSNILKPNDIVLLKASHGIKLNLVVDYLDKTYEN